MAGVARMDGASFVVASHLLLLLLLPVRTSSLVDFSIEDFTWNSSKKLLTVENDGTEAVVEVSVYTANTTADPADLGRPADSSISVMLPEGKTEEVDLSAISITVPELCGQYFVCAEVLLKNYSTSDYRCVSQIKSCNEDVDLKWSLESIGALKLKISLRPNGFVKASGLKVSIENGGDSGMSSRSALNTPEVVAFLSYMNGFSHWNYSAKSLQDAMEEYVAWSMYLGEEFDEYAVRVSGWELLMVDMVTRTSKALGPKESMEVDLRKLKGPSWLPHGWADLVLIIDPFNRTNDSNRTNNYCILPLRLKSSDDRKASHCVVIPDVETEGRNALLLSKDSRQSAGYIYEGGPGRGGIMEATLEEMREKYMDYSWASDRMVRLLKFNLCPSHMDMMGANDSLLNKAKLVLETVLRDINKLEPDEPEMKDAHETVLQILSLVDNLTDLMIEKDGVVRRIFLKLAASYIKNVYQPSIMMSCLYGIDGCDEPGGCVGMGPYDDMGPDFDDPVDGMSSNDEILFPDNFKIPGQFSGMDNNYEGFRSHDTEDCINRCGDESRTSPCYWSCKNMGRTEKPNEEHVMGYDHNQESSRNYGEGSNSNSSSNNGSSHGGMDDMPVRNDTPFVLRMAIIQLMTKITQQLRSDIDPEDIKELSFLPPSMRRSIKDLFVKINEEDSKLYVLMGVFENLEKYIRENGIYEEKMMTLKPEKLQELKSNKSMEAMVNLTLEYINITKKHWEEISDIVLTMRGLDPQMLCPMIKKPGPSPTKEMYCLRVAQNDVAEMSDRVKPPQQEKFFKNPLRAFLKSLKQGWRHPVYWIIENEEVHYGRRNPLTGFFVWDKVAVCSCSRGGRRWSSSKGYGKRDGQRGHTEWRGSVGEFDDGFTVEFNRGMEKSLGVDFGERPDVDEEYENGFWYEPRLYENGGRGEGLGGDSDDEFGVGSEEEFEELGFRYMGSGKVADRPGQGIDRLRGTSQSRAIYQNHPHMSMVNDGPRLAQSLKLSSITLKNHQREDVEDLRIERGQVVVFNKQRGQHSSVCDDQDWGIQEAKVVCRALYSNDPDYVLWDEMPFSLSHNDSSAPDVMLDKLDCSGMETDLLLCTHRWGKGNCEVKELAGVECKLLRRESKYVKTKNPE